MILLSNEEIMAFYVFSAITLLHGYLLDNRALLMLLYTVLTHSIDNILQKLSHDIRCTSTIFYHPMLQF